MCSPKPARWRSGSRQVPRGRSVCRSDCSTPRSSPISRTASNSRAISRRSPLPAPIFSRAWLRSARSATRSSTEVERLAFRDDEGRVQRVGAYGVCVDDDRRILLCRLTAVTSRPGWWTLPGGGVDFGEHQTAALLREIREETGLDAVVGELLEVDSIARFIRMDASEDPVDYHAVRVIYRATVTGGSLVHEVSGTT